MRQTNCKTETLLNGTSCDLQYCPDCKLIHVVLGSITLHLSQVHFQEFVNDLAKGAFNLKSRDMQTRDFEGLNILKLHS